MKHAAPAAQLLVTVLVLVLGLIGTVDTGFLVLMQTGIQVHQYIVYTTHY
jgi:hypothetical protein